MASPKEFINTYKVGKDQLLIFSTTLVVTLATDLLIGIAAGVGVKILLHVLSGAPLGSLFRAKVDVEERDGTYVVKIRDAAIFSNWIALKNMLAKLDTDHDLVIDLSDTRLVDHTVMTKFEAHQPRSAHPHAATRQVGKATNEGSKAA